MWTFEKYKSGLDYYLIIVPETFSLFPTVFYTWNFMCVGTRYRILCAFHLYL